VPRRLYTKMWAEGINLVAVRMFPCAEDESQL